MGGLGGSTLGHNLGGRNSLLVLQVTSGVRTRREKQAGWRGGCQGGKIWGRGRRCSLER